MVLPDPFRGMGAWRNSTETQLSNSLVLLVQVLLLLLTVVLGTRLFVKIPRPGESEVTFSDFESSCHLLLQV